MLLLQRYVGRTIIGTTLLLILMLMGVEFVIMLIQQFKYVGRGDFGMPDAIVQVFLGLPFGLYKFFPMAAMLGSLMGLGLLASHSELVVMRTSGVSILQLIWAVVKASTILVLIVTILGEYVSPKTEFYAEALRTEATSGGQSINTVHGTWIRNGNTFIHINSILPGKKLQGVTWYTFNAQQQLTQAAFARSGIFDGNKWILSNIKISLIEDDKVTTQQVAQQILQLEVEPELIGVTEVKPRQMSLYDLYKYIEYQEASGQSSGTDQLWFWNRIFQPLATLVMMFLAIPFVFGSQRTASMGVRLLIGATIGFLFYIMNSLFGPISLVYQFPPALAALLPSLVFFMMGLVLLRRVR